MGETPRTRDELLNRLANYCSADARDIEIVVKALEAHGLRIVPIEPTQEMVKRAGLYVTARAVVAASPYAPEEKTQ